MSKPAPLILHSALLDWLTVTSFEDSFYAFWKSKLQATAGSGDERKTLQYDGWSYDLAGGTGFLGTAMQRGVFHYMLRLSGYAAEDLKEYVYSQVRQGFAAATRIDLQITVEKPMDWSQWGLLTRLKDRGRMTGWIESKAFGDAFETVYVGGRKSERFTRVYVKKAFDTLLLRYEVEYKGRRARAVTKDLANDGTAGRFLMHELQTTTADDGLRAVFEPSLSGAVPLNIRLKVETSAEKTENWLISQVLPSFTRHINDHQASGRVLAAFYAACKDAIER